MEANPETVSATRTAIDSHLSLPGAGSRLLEPDLDPGMPE